jgi:hypothetical protein
MAFSSVLSSSGIPVSAKLNVPSPRALFDLQLGKRHLIELAPDLVRRATQEKLRIWEPSPVRLLALREAVVIAGPWDHGRCVAAKASKTRRGPFTALIIGLCFCVHRGY